MFDSLNAEAIGLLKFNAAIPLVEVDPVQTIRAAQSRAFGLGRKTHFVYNAVDASTYLPNAVVICIGTSGE